MYKYALVLLGIVSLVSCDEARKHKYVDPFAALDRHISHSLAYHYLWPWNQLIRAAAALDVEESLEEPKIISASDRFEIILSVKRFKPQELKIKVKNRYIIVEGQHKEEDDDKRFMANHFVQRFVLPPGSRSDEVTAVLKENGKLSISAPKHELPPPPPEREVPITVGISEVKTEKIDTIETTTLKQKTEAVQSERETLPVHFQDETKTVQIEQETVPVQLHKETKPVQLKKETESVQLKRKTEPVQLKRKTETVQMQHETETVQLKQETEPVQLKQKTETVQLNQETEPIQLKEDMEPDQLKQETKPVPLKQETETVQLKQETETIQTSPETSFEQTDSEATTHIGKIRKKELKETSKTAQDNEVTKGFDGNGLDYTLIEMEE